MQLQERNRRLRQMPLHILAVVADLAFDRIEKIAARTSTEIDDFALAAVRAFIDRLKAPAPGPASQALSEGEGGNPEA